MKNKIILTTVLLSLTLSACSSTKDGKENPSKVRVSTYKGGNITLKEAQLELSKLVVQNKNLQGVNFKDLSDDQKKIIIKEAVMNEISYKEAKKRKLHKDDDYKEALKLFKETFLKQKLYTSIMKESSSDELVKKHYEELVEKLKGQKEINIRYIIVKTEKEARALAAKLSKSPQFFSYQAKKKSLDKETGKKGGDLGFVLKSQLPTQIVKTAEALKKGQVSKTPVQLEDKWVVVGYEGQRDAKISEFSDVKESLSQILGKKAIEDFVKQNLENAEISVLLK